MRNSKVVALGMAAAMTLTACGGNKPVETTAAPITVAETQVDTTAATEPVTETMTEVLPVPEEAETIEPQSEGVKTDLNVATSERLGITLRYPGDKVEVKFVESDTEMDTDGSTCYVMVDPTGITSLMLYAAAADVYGDELGDFGGETTESNGDFTSLKWYGEAKDPQDTRLGADWVVTTLVSTEPEAEVSGATLIMAECGDTNVMISYLDSCKFTYEGMILEYGDTTLTLDTSKEVDNKEFMKESLTEFMSDLGNTFGGMIANVPQMEDGEVVYTNDTGRTYKFAYADQSGYDVTSSGRGVNLSIGDCSYEFKGTDVDDSIADYPEATDVSVPFGKVYITDIGYYWDSEDGFTVTMSGEGALDTLLSMYVAE